MPWVQELEYTKKDKAARVIQKAWKSFLVSFCCLAAFLRYNLDIISFTYLKCALQYFLVYLQNCIPPFVLKADILLKFQKVNIN